MGPGRLDRARGLALIMARMAMLAKMTAAVAELVKVTTTRVAR